MGDSLSYLDILLYTSNSEMFDFLRPTHVIYFYSSNVFFSVFRLLKEWLVRLLKGQLAGLRFPVLVEQPLAVS